MIKNAFNALGGSARGLFRNWRALLLLGVLYAALLATVYVFFKTGVASVWQLVVTALAFSVAPSLFFILQAGLAHAAQGDVGPVELLRRALRDFLKVFFVALPLVALAALFVYLLYKLEAYLPTPTGAVSTGPFLPHKAPVIPLRWQSVLVSSLWLILLGIVLPLLAARLWLSVAREGLKATLKGVHRVAASAFAPASVVVYIVGLFLFGLMPYFVIFTRTPVKSAWAEVLLFGLRLGLAFVFTLWGWAATLGALARTMTTTPPQAEEVAESASAGELPQQA
jgi:hypothetical protein